MIKKMPYIADKTMFKAVAFACKIIREKGWFNKWEREDGFLSATYWSLVECENIQQAEEKKQKLLMEIKNEIK